MYASNIPTSTYILVVPIDRRTRLLAVLLRITLPIKSAPRKSTSSRIFEKKKENILNFLSLSLPIMTIIIIIRRLCVAYPEIPSWNYMKNKITRLGSRDCV